MPFTMHHLALCFVLLTFSSRCYGESTVRVGFARELLHIRNKRARLANYVIVDVRSLVECASRCQSDISCAGFMYRERKCQLIFEALFDKQWAESPDSVGMRWYIKEGLSTPPRVTSTCGGAICMDDDVTTVTDGYATIMDGGATTSTAGAGIVSAHRDTSTATLQPATRPERKDDADDDSEEFDD